jgi:hypothetical protein
MLCWVETDCYCIRKVPTYDIVLLGISNRLKHLRMLPHLASFPCLLDSQYA